MIFVLHSFPDNNELARYPVLNVVNAPAVLSQGLRSVPGLSEAVRDALLWSITRQPERVATYGAFTLRLEP